MTRSTGMLASILLAWVGSVAATPLPAYDHRIIRPHLYDVAGHRMSMNCVGKGSPTVIFEQGGDGDTRNWRFIQPQITRITRTCFYDRVGFGYSDLPAEPITAQTTSENLHGLVRSAGVQRPFVLVGHSAGGFASLFYAERYPEDVAGLVLVDSSSPTQVAPRDEEQRRRYLDNIRQGETHELQCAAWLRQRPLTSPERQACYHFDLGRGADEKAYMLRMRQPAWFEAEASSSRSTFISDDGGPSENAKEEALLSHSLGSKPVKVLVAGKAVRDDWFTDEMKRDFDARWLSEHAEVARRSTRGEFLVIPDAGHFIHRDRPDVVIHAIQEVIEEVRFAPSHP